MLTCVRCGVRLHRASQKVQQSSASLWSSPKTDWKKAVSDAEKIVGYPTSFMSLRCLVSDEISNVALHMRRLVGTKHPLLKTARGFLYDVKYSLQARGLIVLLMSKAAGPGPQNDTTTMVSGIYPSQRTLAEITEMIHSANLVHKGVVDLDKLQPGDGSLADMEFGNKMAVLSGDFLLANASTGLASLRNTYVVEVISQAIGDLMKTEFTRLRDKNGFPSLPQEGATLEDWQEQTYYSSASLLAKSCQAAMMLANHSKETQQKAYKFGEHAAYAHQLQEELRPFLRPEEDVAKMCVTSAPVILYSQQQTNRNLCQPTSLQHREELYNKVLKSTAISETKKLCREHGQQALEAVKHFQHSEARTALENIIDAVMKV